MSVRFPIHHTFGPLVTDRQRNLAFRLQFRPFSLREGESIEDLRAELSQSFGMHTALFAAGRDALLATLRAIELTPGDEVIIQGFTCAVVPNAIHAAGGTPVYCDIDPQTLNLDVNKVQRAITPRTRAVICQHTFGIPADTKKLRAVCSKRNLMLIEDCAHVMPDAGAKGQMSLLGSPSAGSGIGTHGDAVVLSFGRDKAISGVSGGAVLTRHTALAEPLKASEQEAEMLSIWKILHLIGYPLRYHFAKLIWRFPGGANLAKVYLRWMQLMGFLPPVLAKEEKQGKADIILHRLPNACAALALQQLKSLRTLNDHRRMLSAFFLQSAKEGSWTVPTGVQEAIALQKFPVFARDANNLRHALKREQIYLDDGWTAVINPPSVDAESVGYMQGTCPIAEDVAGHITALPVHPTMNKEQAQYLVHALRSYLG